MIVCLNVKFHWSEGLVYLQYAKRFHLLFCSLVIDPCTSPIIRKKEMAYDHCWHERRVPLNEQAITLWNCFSLTESSIRALTTEEHTSKFGSGNVL